MYKNCIKRIIDVVLSGIGIIVLTPIWLILAIAIKIDDPGPVFFRQKRIAQDMNGEKQFFQIFKYRSMKMCTVLGLLCGIRMICMKKEKNMVQTQLYQV